MTQEQLRAELRAEIGLLGSIRAWARHHKVSDGYVRDFLQGRRPPGEKLLSALGVVVSYERA